MPSGTSSKFGVLLIQADMVTQAQLDHALQIQKEQEDRQSIGHILVELGYLTRRALRGAVRRYGRKVLVGELLLADGIVTREQLDAALKTQKATKQSLGSLLVERGILDEDALARALGKQLDILYMAPHSGMVDMNVFCRLPQQFIKSNSVLPVSESDGVVTVVVSDPVDSGLMVRLENALGSNLNIVTCSKTRIDAVVEEMMFRRDLARGGKIARETGSPALSRAVLEIDGKALAGARAESRPDSAFDRVLSDALKKGASDIHLEAQRDRLRVRYRIDGMLMGAVDFPFSLLGPFVRRAKALAGLNPTETRKEQEGRLFARVDGEDVDLRVAVYPSVFGESVAIHCFSKEAGTMPLAELGMLPRMLADYREAIDRGPGALLFVGPTGSGKTTTFYATLSHLNDVSRKIVTIETPVELALDGIVQNSLRRQESADVVEALMSATQHDPDIIALGTVVADEVAEKLLQLSMMGRRILSTMHAEDAASALLRLCNVPGAASFLASCPILLVAQVLVRKVCVHCSEVYVPAPKVLREFRVKDLDLDAIDFRRGVGCSECMGSGFSGRTGIFEMFQAGPEMQKALLETPSVEDIRSIMRGNAHFVPLRHAGFLKAVQGLATLEEVARVLPSGREAMLETQECTLDELCRKADLTLSNG